MTVRIGSRPVATADFEIPESGLGADLLAGILDQEIARSRPPARPPTPRLPSHPLVSVVIATKDRDELLRRCLEGLLQSSYEALEIVIVDNGASTDRTAEMVSSLPDRRLRYFRTPIAGVSRARNRGIAEARGSIIAFTDDDVETDNAWVSQIVRAFDAYPSADAVTGLVLPAALDHEAQVIFEEMGGFHRGFEPRVFTRHSDPTGSAMHPFTVGKLGSGNNMAFRRDSIVRLGGFDESLGPGTPALAGEDLYLLLNVLLSGGLVAYEPAAIVHHHHRSDPEELLKQLTSYGAGLTGMYTRCLLRDPRTAASFLSRVPAGLRHLRRNVLSPFSGLTDHSASPGLRARMTAAERAGVIRGPLLYGRGRLWAGRSSRIATQEEPERIAAPAGNGTEGVEPSDSSGTPRC